MRPLIPLLVCASGCDVVFLDERIVSELCGPYDDPTPVPFADRLPALTHFSAVGDRGIARTTETPPRLIALAFDGTTWGPDAARQANLDELRTNERLHFAQLGVDGTLFGAQRGATDTQYSVYEYTFRADLVPKQWALADNMPVAFQTTTSIFPGGSLVTGAGVDEYRYHVGARENAESGKFLVVDVETTTAEWRPEGPAGNVFSTDAINARHAPTHGALALGRNGRPTLIYAATVRGEPSGSDLYVSERESGRFQVGVPLVLGGDDGEEVEPVTNADCTLLYFRRGDQILQARAR